MKPKTTEEVAELVGHCVRRKLAICPQGGNTGLVGGSVPVFDEVIISTSLMDKIEGKILTSKISTITPWPIKLRTRYGFFLASTNFRDKFQILSDILPYFNGKAA